MPHRSTIWRRKHRRGRQRRRHRGRRQWQPQRDSETATRLVDLINAQLGGRVTTLDHDDDVRAWINELRRSGKSVDLIAVAANDELGLGRRQRRWRKKPELAAILRREYPSLTQKDAESLAANGGDWLDHIDQSGRAEFKWRAAYNRRCISKIFPHIKRRMASYWRQHRDYRTIRGQLWAFKFAERPRLGGDPYLQEVAHFL
jgi:hypothetical protein